MASLTKEEILRIAHEEGVNFIRLMFTDLFGVVKNVEIPLSQLEKAVNNQMMFDGSSIEGFTRIQESDMYLYPDLSTWLIFPWTPGEAKIARLICDVYTVDGKPLLTLSEAMSKGVSWPSLIMCAATLALGSAVTNADIGLTTWLSSMLSPIIINLSPMIMVLIFTLWAAFQTNVSSNMVTSTFVTTAALAITSGMTNINIAGIVVNIGIMASYSFATPPAMPCVAVASSSGWTNTMQMMKYGFMAMFIAVIVATFVGYPIANIVM